MSRHMRDEYHRRALKAIRRGNYAEARICILDAAKYGDAEIPSDDGGCSSWRDEDAGQGRTVGEQYDAGTRAGWAFGLLLLGVVVAVIAWAVRS